MAEGEREPWECEPFRKMLWQVLDALVACECRREPKLEDLRRQIAKLPSGQREKAYAELKKVVARAELLT